MLSHRNLVANVYQFLGPHATPLNSDDNILCFLPLYHIYGLNVMLNPSLILGATLVLMPRFNVAQVTSLLMQESITMMPLVPPAMNALCLAAEAGEFPKNHKVHWAKSGAAPLAPELPRRFTELTGILVCQGYGMTEASPVTHVGYLEPAFTGRIRSAIQWRRPSAGSSAPRIRLLPRKACKRLPRVSPESW